MNSRKRETTGAQPCIWIGNDLVDQIITQADAAFPLETGGTFMGWWTDPATAVITALVDAGPEAQHGAAHFQPDQEWQLQEIARRYESSGRRVTYLGDWHSHPSARSDGTSFTDRRVLRRIICSPAARCANPLMMIVWGEREQWQMSMWCASLRRRFCWKRLAIEQCRIHPYNKASGLAS
jgi:integrative and conjugative element protein (TIGR02256 family)